MKIYYKNYHEDIILYDLVGTWKAFDNKIDFFLFIKECIINYFKY